MRGLLVTLLLLATTASRADSASLTFRAQATGLCAVLPGGRVRLMMYGVGGNVGYVLYPGFEVATGARDVRCLGQTPLVLGARGDLAYVSDDEKRPYREVIHVEPHATAIALLGNATCVVLDTGKIECPREYDGRPAYVQPLADALSSKGEVVEVLPGSMCARLRDGRIVCGLAQQNSGLVELWNGVKQASLHGGQGCVVKLDGTVECLGDNRYGQRGVAALTAAQVAVPNKVPGLTGIVEVAASGGHACARDAKGTVWCWGRANEHQLGEDGYDDARKMPLCELDREAMKRQEDAVEAMRKQCARNKAPSNPHQPPHDDPCGRMLWNMDRSGANAQPIYKQTDTCEIAQRPVRFLPEPVKVDEVKDAIALAVSGSMSCALTKAQRLVCWGGGLDAPQQLVFPPTPVVPPPPPPGLRKPQPSISAALQTGVCVRTAAGKLARIPVAGRGALGVASAPADDVADLLCLPGTVCTRTRLGAISCTTADGLPPMGGVPQDEATPGTLVAMFGWPCLLRADGVVRCGPGFGSQHQTTRVANALSAVGPVADLAGYCAIDDDGVMRCLDAQKMGQPPPVFLEGVKSADGWYGLFGQTGCAAMKDGTVTCSGSGGYGQRGAAPDAVKADVPNVVAGLEGVEEVAGPGDHFCARTARGEVWCWGVATQGETGKAAYAKANELPLCPIDEKTTAAERARLKHEPESKYYLYAQGCHTPGDGNKTLFNAAPTKVPGVTGALAISATAGFSCALLASNAVACWGGGDPSVRTVRLPP